MNRLSTLLLAVALVGCGVTAKDAPPAGTIWFGTAFDPQTLSLTGKTTTVSTTQPFALVGHLTHSAKVSELSIRASLNGSLVNAVQATGSGEGEVVGFPILPVTVAGDWRYDITDVGGNVLASGTVTAR